MNKINQIIEDISYYRYGVIALTLTFGSCLGSVAVLLILKNSTSEIGLILTAIFTMFANAMAIAQAPMKTIVYSFVGSVLVNLCLILTYL